jgi:hypothetical protein
MAKVWKKLQRADSDYTGNVTGTVDDVAVATIKSGASAGTTAKGVTDTAFTSNVLNVANANAALKNSNVDADHVGLGNVTNESKATMFTSPALTGTPTGITATHVNLGNVANESPSTLKSTMSLNNVANETRATILAGNLTGTVGGTANATVISGAASGATANQDTSNTIRAGNITGTIDGTAVATIKSGSAKGATSPVTFRQDAIPTALNAGDMWFDTDDGNKQYRATATGNTTISATTWVAVTASKGAIGLGSVSNITSSAMMALNLTGTIGGTANATVRSGAASGATANQDSTSSILGGTLTGNVTGTVGGTAVATIKSGAASGATANQDTTSSILGSTHTGAVSGNHTGTIGGVANATVRSGAASGATANQDSTSTILGGTLTGNVSGTVGGTAVATIKSGAASGATANQDSTSAIRTGTTKANVGLTNVIDQAITVVSSKLKFGSTTQTLDADKVGGSTLAETKAAAVSTAETNIIGGAPGALQTLDALAAALGDDASFNSTITTSIATKGKAPMTLTAEDVDGDATYTNDPASEAIGQIGVYSGQSYAVMDI